MKIYSLEEHFATPEIMGAWHALPAELQDLSIKLTSSGDIERRLLDLSEERLRLMDETGIDIQVLSLTTPGVQSLKPSDAVSLAFAANDLVAETVRLHPDRFEGFATLPTPMPGAAALELERAVVNLGLKGAMLYGRTRDRNLDHPDFLPIFEAAASLRVPLYLHPQSPPAAVRAAYYSGFSEELDTLFALGGIGWHYETGIQVLRLVLSGLFDRYPDLQIILGHWGEVVLFYLDRIDSMSSEAAKATELKRPIREYFQNNVLVTPSGVFSQRYLQWAKEVLGVERILFSTDYPYRYAPNQGARNYLEAIEIMEGDRAKIAHGNWKRITADIRR